MKIKYIAILATILFYGCSPSQTKKDKLGNNPEYSQEVEARIERITNNLQVETTVEGTYKSKSLYDQMKNYHTPGVSIAVINNGRVEGARGFGKRDLSSGDPVDVKTLFEAGSVSKPVFALTVLRLKEKGIINLDEDWVFYDLIIPVSPSFAIFAKTRNSSFGIFPVY